MFLTAQAHAIEATIQAKDTGIDNFSNCINELKEQAHSYGLTQQTIDGPLADVNYIHRVIELDRKQPEFTQSFDNYFSKRVSEKRVNQGRKLLAEYRPLLDKLHKQYGVPPQYLMAFWGLETNFGSYKGKMPVLDSLATLACDPRRSKFFTQELMTALKLMELYGFDSTKMVGSWAGAMGHTQFMPSAYYSYAIDGDGDGIADLWGSTEDALTSAAHFLQQLGWQRNERWGREVKLPSGFNYLESGSKYKKSLVEWDRLGVVKATGKPLATPDMQASLYLPAGYTGPSFLGYENFAVIMRWNRSIFYAITVGHLADRINGAGELIVSVPKQENIKRSDIKLLQQKLNRAGFDAGKEDGILGSQSKVALSEFQQSVGLVADGFLNQATIEAIKAL